MENLDLTEQEEKIKENFISLTSDLGEVAFDSLLKDGIFRDFPIIGPILSSIKLGKSAYDYLLAIRLLKFIESLEIKSENEINEFKERYFKIDDYPEIGSKILLILEKIDDEIKIQWLAKSLLLLLDKKINKTEFLRISSIINSVIPTDAQKIEVFNQQERITSTNDLIETYVLDHLYSVGLLSTAGFDGGNASGDNAGTVFIINEFGELFLRDLFKK